MQKYRDRHCSEKFTKACVRTEMITKCIELNRKQKLQRHNKQKNTYKNNKYKNTHTKEINRQAGIKRSKEQDL